MVVEAAVNDTPSLLKVQKNLREHVRPNGVEIEERVAAPEAVAGITPPKEVP